MGTWGTGPFDSDMAEDLVDQLATLSAAQRAEVIEARLEKAVCDELSSEILAAAAVVAANVPAGALLPWNEDYPGIASWLRPHDVGHLALLADRALEVTFPAGGWFSRSWPDEDDRRESWDVLEQIRSVLRGRMS
ncbi:DUF4259 domain-containing protein [Actinoplanes sp. NPDC049548]|uniref:DUF4259 domain-containing protein n=1 Tax=Actinoplanes sp. NPDC049548 TaxID=3155152 RepID=UPI003412ADAF